MVWKQHSYNVRYWYYVFNRTKHTSRFCLRIHYLSTYLFCVQKLFKFVNIIKKQFWSKRPWKYCAYFWNKTHFLLFGLFSYINGCKTTESFHMQFELCVVDTFKIFIMKYTLKYFEVINYAITIRISCWSFKEMKQNNILNYFSIINLETGKSINRIK